MTARRSGLVIAAIAAVAVAIAAYLTVTKLSGGLPVCGPSHGCEDVALSTYSSIFGIPTAAFGLVFSTVVALLGLGWWRLGDRRAVIAAYGLGLFGILFVAYLTYLELFVIHAICVWCVGYGLTVVIGWVVALFAVRASARPA